MIKLCALLIIVICLPLRVSAFDLPGKLIYVAGNELYTLDLKSLKKQSFFTGAIVNSLIAKTDNLKQIIISDQGILKKVNIENGEAISITKGRMAAFNEKHKTLFYYKKREDNREWLMV